MNLLSWLYYNPCNWKNVAEEEEINLWYEYFELFEIEFL